MATGLKRFRGLGVFRVSGLGFRFEGFGFRVSGIGCVGYSFEERKIIRYLSLRETPHPQSPNL